MAGAYCSPHRLQTSFLPPPDSKPFLFHVCVMKSWQWQLRPCTGSGGLGAGCGDSTGAAVVV